MMIKLLKNREIRISLILQVLVAVPTCGFSYMMDKKAGWATIGLALLLILIYYLSTCQRYKKIAFLTETVNRLLHEEDIIPVDSYSEGELSILHSEIYKLTVRLREQQWKLENDKVYLADAMADISHQIRTPLTSINLLVQFLADPQLTNERRQELVRELYELLDRIHWLINTLLKISKLDAGTVQFKHESIPMEYLIKKACEPLLVPIELRRQVLQIHAQGDFCGDVAWTGEAIGNIVKNCMEHTPTGGALEIRASENALYTEILIKDNGTGIAKEDIPHIFKRFYKGRDSDQNSFGVGLSLARTIIIGQNGTVKAENCNPNGALFTIRFYKGII